MKRQAVVAVVTAWRQQSVVGLVALSSTLIFTVLGQWIDIASWLTVAALSVTVVALAWQTVKFWRRARQVTQVEHPAAISLDEARPIRSLVCVFHILRTPRKGALPSPVISLLQHLPQVEAVRLVMSPDVDGQPAADERVQHLMSWLQSNMPDRSVDIKLLDVRVPPDRFDDSSGNRLYHALEGLKDLPGLCVDITGGSTVMSLILMRAAEQANLPVTYLIQPAIGQSVTAFYGLTLLSDPDGWLKPEN